jgi:hypothetical protein
MGEKDPDVSPLSEELLADDSNVNWNGSTPYECSNSISPKSIPPKSSFCCGGHMPWLHSSSSVCISSCKGSLVSSSEELMVVVK